MAIVILLVSFGLVLNPVIFADIMYNTTGTVNAPVQDCDRLIPDQTIIGMSTRQSNPHSPILIKSNSDFTEANGISGGTGTDSDPFIIENWSIDANLANGIQIQDTNASYLIRNVTIVGGGITYSSIVLINSTNGAVQYSNLSGGLNSLRLIRSSFILASDNNLTRSRDIGIYIDSCFSIVLDSNDIANNSFYGVLLTKGSNNRISANNVHNNSDDGIWISSAEGIEISNNTVWGNENAGIKVSGQWYGEPSHVRKNVVYDNGGSGVVVSVCRYTHIDENTIFNNTGSGIDTDMSQGFIENNTIYNNQKYDILNNGFSDTMRSNTIRGHGIYFTQTQIGELGGHSLSNNTVNGKPVVYLVLVFEQTISFEAGQVFVCGGNAIIENVTVSDVCVPIMFSGGKVTLRNCTFHGSQYGFYARDANLTIWNSTISSDTGGKDLMLDGRTNITCINVSFDFNKIELTSAYGILLVYSYLNIYVRDTATSALLPFATVHIENRRKTFYYDGITDALGQPLFVMVPAYNYSLSKNDVHNPYTITSSLNGYLGNYTNRPLTVNSSLNVDMNLTFIPWSAVGSLPVSVNSSSLDIPFDSSITGSGISFVELYYVHDSQTTRYANLTGVSRFDMSPINFTDFSTEGVYEFYTIAYGKAMNKQPEPYGFSNTTYDTTRPTYSISPANGAIKYPVTSPVAVSFSEIMNTLSVKVSIAPGEWSYDWSPDGTLLNLTAERFPDGTIYDVEVIEGMDLAGNHLIPRGIHFSSVDTTPPVVLGVTPQSGSRLVEEIVKIDINFSEPMDWTSVADGIIVNGQKTDAGKGDGSNYSFNFTLLGVPAYNFTLGVTCRDKAGNNILVPYLWTYSAEEGIVNGRVTDNNTGTRIGNAALYFISNASKTPIAQASSAPDGSFCVTMPAGLFTVKVVAQDYDELIEGDIAVRGSTIETRDFRLSPSIKPGSISGIVVFENGAPAVGLKITAGARFITTDSNGFYQLTNLVPDIYTITTESIDEFVSCSTVVEIHNGEIITLNFTLRSMLGQVKGLVVDSEGTPMFQAHVVLYYSNGKRTDALTDMSGSFSLAVPVGNYSIRINKSGFNPVQLKQVRVQAGQTTDIGTQTLSRTNESASQLPWIIFSVLVIASIAGPILILRWRRLKH